MLVTPTTCVAAKHGGARRSRAALAVLSTALTASCATLPNPQLLFDLEPPDRDAGPVRQVVFDASATPWFSTPSTVYRVDDGQPQLVVSAPDANTQLQLAPDARLYALLRSGTVPAGLFTVELVPLPQGPPTRLIVDPALGYRNLYLGGEGGLIVTATPLDDPEALRGRFLYVFWSASGQVLARVELDGLRVGVLDVEGQAILLLGSEDVSVYDKAGQLLWEVDGRFRAAALAAGSTVALLNPNDDDRIDEVSVVRRGSITTLEVGSPVFDLALAADGSRGAIAVDQGGLFFVTPSACDSDQCTAQRAVLSPAPLPGTFYVSAIAFLDPRTVAMGVIGGAAPTTPFEFTSGAAVVARTSGEVIFSTPVTLEQRPTWTPSIAVTNGVPSLAGYTPERAVVVGARRRSR